MTSSGERRQARGAQPAEGGTLPRGPRLPSMVQSTLFARDPIGVLSRLRARYGPVFTLRFPTLGPVVAVSSAADVRDLIGSDPHGSHAGEARRAVLPQASPRSSFGADGDRHA